MKLRNLILNGVFLSTLASASSSWAVDLPYRTFVGSLKNFNSFGELGFIHATALDCHPSDGNFGAAFDNIVTVNSITIDQRDDASRTRMQNLRIYTSPTSFVTAQLTDSQAPQTITLPGTGLTSDYFFITVESDYPGADNNPGLTAFTFDGTVGAARTNSNAGIEPTATNQFEPENFFLDVITNGQIVSTTGGPVDALFFEHADATDRSITVTYGNPQTVASVGVGFEGQIVFSYNTRPHPRFITVSDSNGNSQQVTLAPHTLQYGQYALATPFINTTSLTLTLPVGVENYYPSQIFDALQPQSTLTGVTEFQAFADAIVQPVGDGDFDNDGDVDGRDFLLWQRGGSPTPFSAGDLATWQGAYGSPLLAVTAVPEPSAFALAALALLSLASLRDKRSESL